MSAMQGALSAAERSMRSVFVGNIPYEATEEQLKDIFAEVGPVVSFRLVYDRETGKPKGYGFCEYKDQEMALSAMRNLNGYELNGRALRVDNAASEKSKEELKNLQASLGGPPVESPFGPEVSPEKAPDAIAKVMASLPPEQLYELMKQMKMSMENNPNETRNLFVQNPQLAYATLQAQVIMRIVDPETAISMLHSPNGMNPNQPSGLLPTPDGKVKLEAVNTSASVIPAMNDIPSTFTPAPVTPSAALTTNAPMSGPRITSGPQARPSLLGDRPPTMTTTPPKPMIPNQFPERMDPRAMGDHDLRVPPMIDRDMRQAPMMIDKDMRQHHGDQDLRAMNHPPSGMPENRSFDPRYGMQVSDIGNRAPGVSPYDRQHGGPNMDQRAGPNVNTRTGPNTDQRSGPIIDPRAGPNVDQRVGPNMDPRAGLNMNPRSVAHIDPRGGSVMDSRSPYDNRSAAASSRIDGSRNASMPNSNMPPQRMPPQNPRVAAVNSGSPHVGGGSPNISSPRPSNALAAAAAAIAPHDQEKAALIMQVLQLSDQQIALLPPEQRQSIMVLKDQIARSQNV